MMTLCCFQTFSYGLSAEELNSLVPPKTSEWNHFGARSHCCWAALTDITRFMIWMGPGAYPTRLDYDTLKKNRFLYFPLKYLECGNNPHHGQSGKQEPTTLHVAATHDFRGCARTFHCLDSI